jgi:hypothetical protein
MGKQDQGRMFIPIKISSKETLMRIAQGSKSRASKCLYATWQSRSRCRAVLNMLLKAVVAMQMGFIKRKVG